MGQVAAPFGVHGWIKVRPFTEALDALLDYPVWWLGRHGEWLEFPVLEGRVHAKGLIALLRGCPDRDAAGGLKGSQIAVPRAQLPAAPQDQYYWADLIGLRVVNTQGVDLGRVAEMLETGANDVLVVRGERERLIPFIGPVVLEVSLAHGTLRVDWDADY